MTDTITALHRSALRWIQTALHSTAKASGFWESAASMEPRELHGHIANKIALIASEAFEGYEAWRKGNPPDDHLPHLSGLEAELADVVIRAFDLAGYLGIDLAAAISDKNDYNKSRQKMHGKKF